MTDRPTINSTWRHKRTGNLYKVTGSCTMQDSTHDVLDNKRCVLYQPIIGTSVWVRELSEFLERFDRIPP